MSRSEMTSEYDRGRFKIRTLVRDDGTGIVEFRNDCNGANPPDRVFVEERRLLVAIQQLTMLRSRLETE